jgi:hexosaminidase
MIDTSRHYIPIREIYRIIDLLPMSKFNVLHIHLVDAQSFPFNSMSSPDISKGAYSKSATYSVKDIQAISDYGIDRAVRVIFEIDTPGMPCQIIIL